MHHRLETLHVYCFGNLGGNEEKRAERRYSLKSAKATPLKNLVHYADQIGTSHEKFFRSSLRSSAQISGRVHNPIL